jgi:SAM-dependent methyltransferase
VIELLTEEKIRSCDYLRIRCEFYDLWNKLFLNKDQIDKVLITKFGRSWFVGRLASLSRKFGASRLFRKLTPRLRQGISQSILRSDGLSLTSDMTLELLRHNQLWMSRSWEYPWAILNSDVSLDTKILDVGSGYSLFPLYLAQRSDHVDSVDTAEKQMRMLCPALAEILKLKVNYFVDDAANLSAKDNTYDYVFCISVLEHLEEEVEHGTPINRHAKKLDRKAIREFLRVIRPGGRVVLTLDYASEDVSQRSFHFDYVKELIEEFRADLLEPFDKFDQIRFTKEKADEMRRLWPEFFPYDPAYPPGGALGIVLTKR